MKNTTRGLRKDLYMVTQEELIDLVIDECEINAVPYSCDEYGNLWSITHQDKPIFVAHMDTVIGSDLNYKKPLLESDGRLSRPGYVLGADDRAGVNLILNNKDRINWVLTVDEEIGCVGANKLSSDIDFISDVTDIGTFFIELDRRDVKDILGNVHGYCEAGVVEAIQNILTNHKDTSGVFTDIDSWTEIAQGVNLSVGYFNAHTSSEYLDIEYFEYLNTKIVELGQIEGFRGTYVNPYKSYGSTYSKYTYGWLDKMYGEEEEECAFCKGTDHVDYDHDGVLICRSCTAGMSDGDLEAEGITLRKNKKRKETRKCSCCQQPIYENEKYFEVEEWKMTFCKYCVDTKYN